MLTELLVLKSWRQVYQAITL